MLEFVKFDKLARISRDCTITEKLDGTNAQIHIRYAGGWEGEDCFGNYIHNYLTEY
jgi:hypothetical protein